MVAILKAACPRRMTWGVMGVLALLILNGCQEPGPRALLKGERYLEGKEYEKALQQLLVAVELLPNHAQAWNHLGLAYHGLGRTDHARTSYQNALILNHRLASARFNLGSLLLETGEHDQAVDELTSYTMLEPKSGEGWIQLGRAQLQAGSLAEAEKSFRRALSLVPDHPRALNNLGVVQMKRSRPADAMQYFDRATAAHPGYAPAILNEAVVHHRHFQNTNLALKRYQDYLALQPRPEDYEQIAGLVQELEQSLQPVTLAGDASSAPTSPPPIEVLSPPRTNPPVRSAAAPAAPPHQPPASATGTPKPERTSSVKPPRTGPTNLSRATAARPTASTTDAKPATSKPAPAAPKPPPAAPRVSAPESPRPARTEAPATRREPGIVSRRQVARVRPPARPQSGGSSIPRYNYDRPVAGQPGDRTRAELRFHEALKWHKAGRQALAIERYQEAVQLDPTYYEAWFNMGVAAFEGADWQTSLAAYEMARALRPDSAQAHYNFCVTLQKANYPLDALYELRRFLKKHPDQARGHLALANLYDQVFRNPKLARPHYQKVLELNSRHPEAQNIRFWLRANP